MPQCYTAKSRGWQVPYPSRSYRWSLRCPWNCKCWSRSGRDYLTVISILMVRYCQFVNLTKWLFLGRWIQKPQTVLFSDNVWAWQDAQLQGEYKLERYQSPRWSGSKLAHPINLGYKKVEKGVCIQRMVADLFTQNSASIAKEKLLCTGWHGKSHTSEIAIPRPVIATKRM